MAKFIQKREDGTEVEVEGFTQEELDAQKESLKAEYDAKIKGYEDKNLNFTKLKEDSESKIKDLQTQLDTNRNTIINNHKSELMKKLSGGDEEIAKKIELEYSQFQGEAISNEQIESRMFKAAKLAVPEITAPTLNDAFAQIGNRSKGNVGEEPNKPTEVQLNMAKSMGISAEDITKYGNK